MRLFVIEDDENTRFLIDEFASSSKGFIKAIYSAKSLGEALVIIEDFRPDVILFDIHLPDGQIFDAAGNWLVRQGVPLICMSAYPRWQYLDQALETQVVAFIEKGTTENFFTLLKNALYKASEVMYNRQQGEFFAHYAYQKHDNLRLALKETQEQLVEKEQFLRELAKEKQATHFSLPKEINTSAESNTIYVDMGGNEVTIVTVRDIMFVEAERNYVLIHCTGKQAPLRERTTFNDYEQRLQDKGFIRVHRKFLVPLHRIVKIINQFAIMQDGKKIRIAEDRLGHVRTAFRQFHEKR